jgi:Rrf2 family transcriptional regulator, nitric oxide-sensitive transcriptional repressor
MDILVHISAMLSQTAEYALRAVMFLADHDRVTTEDLAAASRVPAGYLSKVLQVLSRKGIVSARRGKSGGFRLARSADKLTILDVVNAVERIQRIRSCPLRISAHKEQRCSLHQRLDEAMVMVEQAFGDTTIRALLNHPTAPKPLCNIIVA